MSAAYRHLDAGTIGESAVSSIISSAFDAVTTVSVVESASSYSTYRSTAVDGSGLRNGIVSSVCDSYMAADASYLTAE